MAEEVFDHRIHPAPQFSSPGSPQDDVTTLPLRVTRAIELNQPVDPYKLILHNGRATRIVDLPTADLRALSGLGHQPSDIRQRDIIPWPLQEGKWLWKPWECRVSDGFRGVWVDDQHLACPGCGMDFT